MTPRRRPWAGALLALSIGLAGASAPTAQQPESASDIVFPGDRFTPWPTVSPTSIGWDTEALDEVTAFARDHQSTALLILYQGRIVVEQYWTLNDPRVYRQLANLPPGGDTDDEGRPIEDVGSVQKGALGLLVSIAASRDLVDLDAPVTRYLGPGWTDATPAQEEQILVRHLMSMSSGLTREFQYDAAPDERWYYNTQVYSRLFDVLTEVSGLDPHAYTAAWLTTPLGMHDTRWAQRAGGANRYGLTATARDLGRMGLLMQTRGVWRDQRLVDRDVMSLAVEPSQTRNPAYGLLWWVNGQQQWDDWTNTGMREGSFIPTAPDDLIAARGFGDRKIYVVPSLEVVVIRLGNFAKHGADNQPDTKFFDLQLWRLLRQAIH